MALVKDFKRFSMERNSIHDEIEAKYAIFERDGRKFVQIDTFGRDDRQIPGKKSQTIQLDSAMPKRFLKFFEKNFASTEGSPNPFTMAGLDPATQCDRVSGHTRFAALSETSLAR
jgi:hypothetical protein